VGHGAEIVHFVGSNFGDDMEKIRGVAKIAVVKEKFKAGLRFAK